MTSNHEGWGLVLTEAMQFGCIPVAFDSFESIHEIIRDGENGLLVKPFHVYMYANKIFKLANSPIIQEYRKNALNSMEKLIPSNIINQWMTLFHWIIKEI